MTIVEVLRAVACAIAIFNLTWSFGGFCDLTRGRFWPPSFYMSVIFWMSATAVSFQLSYLFNPAPVTAISAPTLLWRVLSFSMLISALALAAWGHARGYTRRARVLYAMADHVGEARAIVDLARVDPVSAERLAAECRALTVKAIVDHG